MTRCHARAATGLICAISTLVFSAGAAPRARAPRAPYRGSADAQIASIVGAQPDRWGILVKTLDGGRIVYAHNPQALLAPASNEKVFTTAAALEQLGPKWTTRTSVFAHGDVDSDGVLRDGVVLYGRGDPNLSGRFSATGDALEPLRSLANQLVEHGVRRIEGGVVADDSYLTGAPHGAGWAWADIQWHFGAEVSALSFNDNLATVQVLPGASAGEPCQIVLTPDVGYLEVVNTTVTSQRGVSKIAVHGALDAPRIEVSGTLALGYPGWRGEVAVHDPAAYTAAAFRRALSDAGIEVVGPTMRMRPDSERPESLQLERMSEIASIDSLPLADLIKVVNRHSQNLHAEMVLRLLGREKGPSGLPDDEAGTAVVVSYLQTHNLLSPGVRVLDGSGLSRLDRTTVAALQGVAQNISEHDNGIYFLDSLPEPGEDGTLRRRLWGVQVRAKSGSLATSKSLTGYVTTAGGRRLSFSIVYNGPAGSSGAISQIDEMIAAIAQSDAP